MVNSKTFTFPHFAPFWDMKICNTIDLELNISMPPKVKSNGVAALKIYMIPVDVNV